MARATNALSLNDFEILARGRLPRPIFGYVAGASEDNLSAQANASAFQKYGFVPRVLVNVSQRSTSATFLSRTYDAPFGIAPMGIAALSAYRGDLVLARAAAAANIPMVLSGSSLIRMEEVIREAPDAWFQAYLPGDPARIDPLIDRVRAAGFRTLVVTVDIPVHANRENNVRNGFSTPLRPSLRLAVDGLARPRWLLGTLARSIALHGMPHFENSFAERGAPILSPKVLRDFSNRSHLDWQHIDRIRQRWSGHMIVKGVLSPRDALKARQAGIDAIVISNHGGRQLDGAVAPLDILPQVIDVVGGMPVMVDGGIRRGSDVLKALALGASFVLVGRPFNFAAAAGGQAGVAHAIALLAAEVDRNMAMLGIGSVAEISGDYIWKHSS